MSEDEKRTDEEAEVEGHRPLRPKASDEPRSEDEESDDVEAHGPAHKFK